MTLKDWKENGKDNWQKGTENHFVTVSYLKNYWPKGTKYFGKDYTVNRYAKGRNQWVAQSYFKTKSKALAYAKSYMRKN